MPEATITSKGQVTIPKQIRQQLKLHTGDKVYFQTDSGGGVIIKKSDASIKDRAGRLLGYAFSEAVSLEEMNEAIRKRAAEQYEKSK